MDGRLRLGFKQMTNFCCFVRDLWGECENWLVYRTFASMKNDYRCINLEKGRVLILFCVSNVYAWVQ